jgi:hypothetical protein
MKEPLPVRLGLIPSGETSSRNKYGFPVAREIFFQMSGRAWNSINPVRPVVAMRRHRQVFGGSAEVRVAPIGCFRSRERCGSRPLPAAGCIGGASSRASPES